MTINANQKLFSLTQLLHTMKQDDPEQARYRKDTLIEGLKKRKRTAVKIATAIHGATTAHHLMEEGKDDPSLSELHAVQEGINRSSQLYHTFEKVWRNYCAKYWSEQIYDKDYLYDYC
tara:strand:- start:2222 stop:2575 length:354 start_codon:yes stop_codon:yes gene_type:complete